VILDQLNAGDYSDALGALFVCLACWVAGVGWAVYRAVGWVERMRAWAQSVPLSNDSDPGTIAGAQLDPKGVN